MVIHVWLLESWDNTLALSLHLERHPSAWAFVNWFSIQSNRVKVQLKTVSCMRSETRFARCESDLCLSDYLIWRSMAAVFSSIFLSFYFNFFPLYPFTFSLPSPLSPFLFPLFSTKTAELVAIRGLGARDKVVVHGGMVVWCHLWFWGKIEDENEKQKEEREKEKRKVVRKCFPWWCVMIGGQGGEEKKINKMSLPKITSDDSGRWSAAEVTVVRHVLPLSLLCIILHGQVPIISNSSQPL